MLESFRAASPIGAGADALMDAMMGFAAGVMVAASCWSLLVPFTVMMALDNALGSCA